MRKERKTMDKLTFAFVAVAFASGCAVNDPACCRTDETGFVSLFNGRDLSGWCGATEMYGVDPNEPGVLQCFPDRKLPKGKRGDLWTEKEYGDFVLRFEFSMPANGNNGLGVHYDVKDGQGSESAYDGMCELQLLDDGGSEYYDAKTGKDKLKPYQYTGSVYGIIPCRRDNPAADYAGGGSYLRRPGEWNCEEVTVVGSVIEVRLNGRLITKGDVSKFRGDGDTPDGKLHPGLHRTRGPLAWMGHGHNVKWRNVRIKELK